MSRGNAKHALRWSYIAAWTTKSINIVSMFVLARVLGPEAFGLIATVMVSITFLELFTDSGLGMAIVQRDEIEPEDLDSLFWFNILVAIGLCVCGFLFADAVANLTNSPQLSTLFMALSPLILLKSLTVVQYGLAVREHRFKTLATRDASAAAAGGLCGIAAALMNFGVWSLVVTQLVTAVVAFILLWSLGSWRPSWRFHWKRTRSFIGFGSGLLLSQIAVFGSNNADVVVMRSFFGDAAIGIVRLSNRLVNTAVEMLVRPAQLVANARLAALQGDTPAMQAEVLRLMRSTTSLAFPAMVALAVSACVLSDLLGSKWEPAESAIQILVAIGIAKSVTLLAAPALLASGKSYQIAAGSWLQFAVMSGVLVSAGFLARNSSLDDQVSAMAWARTGGMVLLVVPFQLWRLLRVTHAPFNDLVRAIAPGMFFGACTLLAGCAALFACQWCGTSDRVAQHTSAAASVAVAAVFAVTARRRLQALKAGNCT